MKKIIISLFSVILLINNMSAQCDVMPAVPDCSGGTALTDGESMSGVTRIVDNISTDYTNISMSNSAVLIICSGIHNITFSGFTGTLYVKEGATLVTNRSDIPSGISIYNWGTLNFTNGVSINNSSAFINEGNMSVTGDMVGNGAVFTNRGAVSVSGTLGNWQNSGGLCMDAGSSLSTTNISWNSLNNWVSAEGGAASCISYTGTASGTNSHPFSGDADLNICQNGSDLTGDGGWGSATVTKPCTNCSGILPIKLKTFYSQSSEKNIVLRWVTASEKNNALFEIQRSTDGVFWEVIHTTAGADNSSSDTYYSCIDETASIGNNYYRIKQIDFNGDYTYSYVISDYLKNRDVKLRVYPTISTAESVIAEVTSIATDNIIIDIFNMEGKLMCSTLISLLNNTAKINLAELCNFTPGTYTLRAKGVENVTFIVK